MTPQQNDQYNIDTMRERLLHLQERIAQASSFSNRPLDSITTVAVSKYHPSSSLRTLFQLGQTVFGENYIQECLQKQNELRYLPIQWHFIGHLQRNKAKYVIGRFHLLHGLDSLKLARTLQNLAENNALRQAVLIQVNLAHEESKHGITEQDLAPMAEELMAMNNLDLQGLMCMPPYDPDPERSRPLFARLRELRDSLASRLGVALPHLSMGMSHDCAQAIQEGATLIRVGTDLFGPRPIQTV